MWLKILGAAALILFLVGVVAVLQGWSKSTASGRLVGVGFMIVMGLAAVWGMRTLLGIAR